jgi:adenylate kinase
VHVSLFPAAPTRQSGHSAVLLLGTPGSGKSTLSGQLASRHNARVFRLREYVQERARADPGLAAAMRARSNALGWLPDQMALSLVGDAVTGPFRPSGRSMVVFEGYPGNGVQADRLARLLRRLYVPPLALVLRLHPEIAWQRARQRRVCPSCAPEVGEPHRPALVSATGLCTGCGGPVKPRSGDSPQRLAARTERHRQQLPHIRRTLCAWGVPWRVLDAHHDPARLLAAAEVELAAHFLKELT